MNNENYMPDYYKILELNPSSSLDEVKKKYKQKALEIHPDKNKNVDSHFKMQKLNEAKEVLTNKKLKTEYDENFFFYSLKNGDSTSAISFLKNKIPSFIINKKDNTGDTPLHYACFHNFLEIVELLIRYGANVNIQNKNGNTPLHYACFHNFLEIVELLIRYGANVNIQNKNGNTPLHYAVISSINNTKLIGLLLNNKSKVKIKNQMGYNCLDFAQDNNLNLEIHKLLSKKFDIEIKTDKLKIKNNLLFDIEKSIKKIEADIKYFEQKKINPILNFVIKFFSFGCINKNKDIKNKILFENNELKKLQEEKQNINNQIEKLKIDKKNLKINFNLTKINSVNLQNQPSRSGYKPSSSQM